MRPAEAALKVWEGCVPCLILFVERRRGKNLETRGLIVGRQAQVIPVLTSIIDQIEAPALSPGTRMRTQFAK